MTIQFWFFLFAGLAISTLLGAYVVRTHREYGLMILGGFLAIYVVSANILVPRLVDLNLFGFSFILVTGSIIWPYTAQVSDMLNEIYGKRAAYLAAAMAYTANLMFVIFVLMAFQVTPIWDAAHEGFFHEYFGIAWRILIASICSYTAANYADITLFSKIKKWAANREQTTGNILIYSGLRSAVSDGLNMVVDNIVFYTIAFAGTMPNNILVTLILTSMAAKFILSQIDLPFYWGFRLMTRNVKRDF